MWMTYFGKHPTDEVLLSYADGELSSWKAHLVSKHQNNCWECRARLAEIDETVQLVARTLNDGSFLPPERQEAAIRRFLASRDQVRPAGTRPRLGTLLAAHPARLLAAAAVLLAVAAAWFSLPLPPSGPRPPDAWQTLARARATESALAAGRGGIRQAFDVEVWQIDPPATPLRRRLEVWTDPAGRRRASRWTNSRGNLQFAVWTRAGAPELIFDPESGAVPLKSRGVGYAPAVLADAVETAADPNSLERALLRWIRAQHWSPVLITSDLAAFVSRAGVTLAAARVRLTGGEERLRLTAHRTDGDVRMEFLMEVDAGSSRPRLSVIRRTGGGCTIEVRLSGMVAETVARERLDEAIFRPRLVASSVPKTEPPVLPPATLAPPPVPVTVYDTLASTQVEIYSVLHRLAACVREHPEVLRQDGRIVVRAVTADAQRRKELLAALEPLRTGAPVDVFIEVNPRGNLARKRRAQAGPLLDAAALLAADLAYRQAVALVRLADSLDDEAAAALTPHARELLEEMKRDHASGISAAIRQSRDGILPRITSVPHVAVPPIPLVFPSGGADWRQRAFAVFHAVDTMDDLVQSLAGAADDDTALKARASAGLREVFHAFQRFLSDPELAIVTPSAQDEDVER